MSGDIFTDGIVNSAEKKVDSDRIKESLPYLVLLLLFAIPLLFWNLGEASISTKDEYLHIRAAQDMYQRGNYVVPIFDFEPYVNKPPLKMWLTQIPLELFGESNWAYRLPDAFAGVFVLLCIFWFSMKRFSSLLPALASSLALLGFQPLFDFHGFRMANQDALLLAFLCLSFILGYTILSKKESDYRRLLLYSVLIGAALLTKSVAALISPIVLFCFWLWHPERRKFSLKEMVALVLPCAFLVAAYAIALTIVYPHAWGVLFGYEIAGRFDEGYHNADDFLLYWKLLFPLSVFSFIFAFSLFYAFLRAFCHSCAYSRLLLLWFFLPLVLYSFLPSRLPWYVFPSFPAAALIVGCFVDRYSGFGKRSIEIPWRRYFQIAVLALVFGSIFYEISAVNIFLRENEKAIAVDRFVRDAKSDSERLGKIRYLVVDGFEPQKHERAYFSMLGSAIRAKRWFLKHGSKLRKQKIVVLLSAAELEKLAPLYPAVSFRLVPPYGKRKDAFLALSFNKDLSLKNFQPCNGLPFRPGQMPYVSAISEVCGKPEIAVQEPGKDETRERQGQQK